MSLDYTNTADIHRGNSVAGSRGVRTWEPVGLAAVSDVSCSLQPRSGEVRSQAAGAERVGTWEGFFPDGTDIRVGDFVKNVTGPGPARFKVVFVGEQGSGWDIEVDLQISEHDF